MHVFLIKHQPVRLRLYFLQQEKGVVQSGLALGMKLLEEQELLGERKKITLSQQSRKDH